jgi:hypothetical protein
LQQGSDAFGGGTCRCLFPFGTGPGIKRLDLAKLLPELKLTIHDFVALSSQEPIPNTNQINTQKNNLENDQAVLPVNPASQGP